VNSLQLTVDVSVGDSTFKLCGTEIPGTITPTGTLTGNVDQDIDAATGGLFEYCSKNWGTVADFAFEPSTTAGLQATGQILITPLSFGGDEYGAPMTSDISFQTVGDITYGDSDAVPVRSWIQTMSPKQAPTPPAALAAGSTSEPEAAATEPEPVPA